ncbi:MAG TPA: ankyrin repeat domain-containing protein [Patescibacteria group bacterium]|nr:ankyrin repeat domain-containing protein [Patescibacteria group bacterium]
MQDDAKTFLMFCENNDAAMMALCLRENPALVDVKDSHGTPALHKAVEIAGIEAVEVLLKNNVDTRATDEFNRTAADLARLLNFTQIALMIDTVERVKAKEGDKHAFRAEFEQAIRGFEKGNASMTVPRHKYRWKK